MNAKHALLSITLATVLGLAACNPSTETTTVNPVAGSIPDSVIVPAADAERMIANYVPRAGYVIRDGDTLPNARSITFGLELLEAFLAEVRSQGVSRVTIHLAAYDDDYPLDASFQPDPQYWGYNTVLLAPAVENNGGAAVDIGVGNSDRVRQPVVNKGELSPPR